jgi:sodium transport system ATP-binding protein
LVWSSYGRFADGPHGNFYFAPRSDCCPMIHVHELTKHYCDLRRGQFAALDGISFRAKPGQVYGLLGPNGAGKTTALRILSTVLRPTAGTASVNGFDVVTQSAQVRRQIGFMSANTGVYDRMTGWETVAYFGRLHSIPEGELSDRMEALFERLKMNDTRDVLGAKMSTGMKQKVSVARAVVHDPPVLIFDEATAGLDVLVARAVVHDPPVLIFDEATAGLDVLVARALLNTVAELRDHGKCIVFSTHIMREAERLCDRIAIMHRGQILAEGTLEELRDLHHQRDLEELFFQLISHHDEATCSPAPAT